MEWNIIRSTWQGSGSDVGMPFKLWRPHILIFAPECQVNEGGESEELEGVLYRWCEHQNMTEMVLGELKTCSLLCGRYGVTPSGSLASSDRM